jgi:hypothetical protein
VANRSFTRRDACHHLKASFAGITEIVLGTSRLEWTRRPLSDAKCKVARTTPVRLRPMHALCPTGSRGQQKAAIAKKMEFDPKMTCNTSSHCRDGDSEATTSCALASAVERWSVEGKGSARSRGNQLPKWSGSSGQVTGARRSSKRAHKVN